MSDELHAFERERWRDELRLRERELDLREREVTRSGWWSPLVVAVAAAAFAAAGNALVTFINGEQMRALEAQRADRQVEAEARRAESARILEVIRSGDTETIRTNLDFLLAAGLLETPELRERLSGFLARATDAELPRLPQSPTLPQSPDDVDPAGRRLHVLAVGIADYQHLPPLPDPHRNVEVFTEAALSQQTQLYEDAEATRLHDPDRASLLDAVAAIVERVDTDARDAALIYLDARAVEVGGEVFLVLPATRADTADAVRATAVSLADIARLLRPLTRISPTILILNICPRGDWTLPQKALADMNIDMLVATAPGTACFDGGLAPAEPSPMFAAIERGFTMAADGDDDGFVSVDEFTRFVRRAVLEATEGAQVPFSFSSSQGGMLFEAASPRGVASSPRR